MHPNAPAIYHIFNSGDLYEFEVTGTLVKKITRYVNGGDRYASLEFKDLPQDVVDQLLDKVRESQEI